MSAPDTRDGVLAAFRQQVAWCEQLGSSFTARVLALLAEDIAAGGIAAELVGIWPGDPVADAVALRLAGAVHALTLQGTAPALARFYPPDGVPSDGLGPVLRDALARHRAFVARFLESPPQTNEVGRSAVLLGGFLMVAGETSLPLRTLEIGASAGLNSLWDRYRYRLGERAWGDPASPVVLAPAWEGPTPRLDARVRVLDRRACDLSPVDLEEPAARLRLAAYVWPDQGERSARLAGAIAIARSAGLRVERADAAGWVRDRLGEPAEGAATVLFHSIMWQYMPEATRAAIRAALAHAAERATPGSPLAWLRFEPAGPASRPELRLTLWPGGQERILAIAQPHGQAIQWAGGDPHEDPAETLA